MNLTIEELRNSGFAESINQLRKHQDPQISNEAKLIRNHLKQVIIINLNLKILQFDDNVNDLFNL